MVSKLFLMNKKTLHFSDYLTGVARRDHSRVVVLYEAPDVVHALDGLRHARVE